jgi:hypothetical protein
MANWLDKALGRRSATIIKPVPFVRPCPCGEQLSGIRQERARRLICAECGEPHFILPVNLYPESRRIHFQPLEVGEFDESREYEQPPELDVEPEMDLDSVEEEIPRESRATPPAPDLGRALLDDWEDDQEEPPVSQHDQAIVIPQRREERAGQRQKLLLVGTAFFVLIGAMVVWAVWDRGKESAEIRLQMARDAGLIALESGDFVTARREFAEALDALQTLGVTGEQHDSLHDLWMESEAAVGLTNRSLLELVESANRTLKTGTIEDWDSEFHAIFEDQWILIDQSPPQIVPGDAKEGRRIDLLWDFDNDIPIQVTGIERLLTKTQTGGPRRIVFAGQLAGCRRESNAWVVELNPENAFLWRRFRSIEQLGFTDDQEPAQIMRDLIESQAELPEVSEAVSLPQENPDAT